MKKFTLYEIRDSIEQISDDITQALMDEDDVLADELMEELEDYFEIHDMKVEAYVRVIKNSEAGAKACKEQAAEFSKHATALSNLAKRLKNNLLMNMNEREERTTGAGPFKLRIQKNSVPTVDIEIPVEELPEEYQIVEVKADKHALAQAFKYGETIEGVTVEKGEHLRIAIK